MKPTKQTVYLPVKSKYRVSLEVNDIDTGETKMWVEEQQAFVFTPEQLNEYTANVVRQALETAAEKADAFIDMNEDAYIEGNVWSEVDKESITNTLEETCKKFEV